MAGHAPNAPKKAGLSGLFCNRLVAAICLLTITGAAVAAPLKVEVASVQAAYDQRTNEPVITFTMSDSSRKAFAELTRANVGRKLAIRIDGKTVSEPVIREPILGGAGQIAGRFTIQQARDIAARLSAGTAKLEVEIVN